MNIKRIKLCVLVLIPLVLLASVASRARGQDDVGRGPAVEGEEVEEVIVLFHGGVLRGVVKKEGGTLIVRQETGVVRVPKRRVAFRARTLHEAYRQRSDALSKSAITERIQLAQWCIGNQLWDEAIGEALTVMAHDGANRQAPQLLRRIEALKKQQEEIAAAQAKPPAKTPGKTAPPVNLVSAVDLPHASMQTFTNTIQPLMVNRCGANACHGGRAKSEFRLLQPTLGHSYSHRFTQRNLAATLAMVDRKNPDESRLIQAALEAHGGMKTPLFNETNLIQVKQLVGWVRSLASRDATGLANKGATPARPASTQTPHWTPGSTRTPAQPATYRFQQPRTRPSGRIDPFDPDEFNRRFFSGEDKGDGAIGLAPTR
ncbi:MAG: hypothetical protein QGG36_20875 [Pirellulaceae bacterium]|jgi:hypothetical protein|nr:hypothetical protein [Pirellulaceae bacterium]